MTCKRAFMGLIFTVTVMLGMSGNSEGETIVLPPAANPSPVSKAQIDAAMASVGYRPDATAASPLYLGAANGAGAIFPQVTLPPGHWGIAAFPTRGGCQLVASYRTSANNALPSNDFVPVDTSLGFPLVRVDMTAVNTGTVAFKITAEPSAKICTYQLELYSQR